MLDNETEDEILSEVLQSRKARLLSTLNHLSPAEKERKWQSFCIDLANSQFPKTSIDQYVRGAVPTASITTLEQQVDNSAVSNGRRGDPYGSAYDIGISPDVIDTTGKVGRQSTYRGRIPDMRPQALDAWLLEEAPFDAIQDAASGNRESRAISPWHARRSLAAKTMQPEDWIEQTQTCSAPIIGSSQHPSRTTSQSTNSFGHYQASPLSSSPYSGIMAKTMSNETEATSIEMSRSDSLGSAYYRSFNQLGFCSPVMSRESSGVRNNISFTSSQSKCPPNDLTASLSTISSQQCFGPLDGMADHWDSFKDDHGQFETSAEVDESFPPIRRTPSSGSGSSTSSRLIERTKTHVKSAERTIEPKSEATSTTAIRHAAQARIRTSSESLERPNPRVQIARLSRTHMVTDKMQCQSCDASFKGYHELRRHSRVKHEPTREVWMCIGAPHAESCSACSNHKRYNAQHNACAHLRRRHFNRRPTKSERKRGARLSEEQKRGGKGGGKWPAIKDLIPYLRSFSVNSKDGMPVDDYAEDRSANAYGDRNDIAHFSSTIPFQAWDIPPLDLKGPSGSSGNVPDSTSFFTETTDVGMETTLSFDSLFNLNNNDHDDDDNA